MKYKVKTQFINICSSCLAFLVIVLLLIVIWKDSPKRINKVEATKEASVQIVKNCTYYGILAVNKDLLKSSKT